MTASRIDYFEFAEGNHGWTGLYLYLTAKMPIPPLTPEAALNDQAWNSYLVLEDKALAADAGCRSAKRVEGLRLLAPRLDEFEQRFDDELAALPAQWAEGVAQAEAEGFVRP